MPIAIGLIPMMYALLANVNYKLLMQVSEGVKALRITPIVEALGR